MEKIEIINNLKELTRIEDFLAENELTNSLDAKNMFQLNLILEEIITNIVSYGYADELEHKILIEIDIENSYLSCRISDDGKAFDPLIIDDPELHHTVEERKIGGLGIHFVKTMIDEVKYKRENNKNILEFRKKI